jgi:hypothetical protein
MKKKLVVAPCDCCNKRDFLEQCWLGGLETWACDACRSQPDAARKTAASIGDQPTTAKKRNTQ